MKNIFLTLFLGLSSMLFAQSRINGVVTDTKGLPLANVSVQIHEINTGTTTDSIGYYVFNNVPKGTLEISFILPNYDPIRQLVKVAHAETTLNVMLIQSVHQMDEVVVSTAFNKLQSQNVVKVEHATIRALQREGVINVAEGLATIPGVSQLSTGTSIGKPVIRGLTGNRVLVYSQGIRMENQQFGDEHGIGLNSNGIESVEVIKGPASLLYGSDALGGVIYLNPEKYADAGKFTSDVTQRFFSNTLGTVTSLGLKGSKNHWKFLARGSAVAHSDYQVPNGDRVTNTRFRESDLKGGVAFSDGRFAADFRYNYNALAIGIPEEGIGIQSEQKSLLFPNQRVKSHVASLRNSYFFNSSKLEATFGYSSNIRQEFEEPGSPALDMNLNTLSYDVKYTFPQFGRVELIGGVQGLYQTNKNFAEEALIPDATTVDAGIFTTSRLEFSNEQVLQAGLRIDTRKIESDARGTLDEEGYFEALSRSFTSFNASLGYKANIAANTLIRLNVASGFRAPNLAELTSNGVHEGNNRYEIGNGELKNEQNIQADLNLEYDRQHLAFYGNLFYNHVNGFIYTSPDGTSIDDHDVYRYTQEDARLFGGEIGLHFHPHPLDWLHVESSFETVTGKKDNGDFLPLIPANSWSNTIRTEFGAAKWLTKGYAKAEIAHTFDQENVSDDESASKGYTILNMGIGGIVNFGKAKFDVSLAANNLLNEEYIPHLSRLKSEGIPNIGRNIVFNLNFNLF
ncbi:MAG TPA: TonB-dependent receptor [Flavobacterium sp.]